MKIKNVLGHPVRAAILGCLAGRRLTRKQLERLMGDTPSPTVYRNLRILIENGYARECERLPGRGQGEIVYEPTSDGLWVDVGEVRTWSPEERVQVFQTFVQTLAVAYRAYVAGGGKDLAVGGSKILYLTDEEAGELRSRIRALTAEQEGPRRPGTKRWLVADAMIPDEAEGVEETAEV